MLIDVEIDVESVLCYWIRGCVKVEVKVPVNGMRSMSLVMYCLYVGCCLIGNWIGFED